MDHERIHRGVELTEPFYIRQSHEKRTPQEVSAFFMRSAEEAKAEGANLCRFSHHPDDKSLLLVECWREKVVEDQGPLRWSLALKPETGTQDETSAKGDLE